MESVLQYTATGLMVGGFYALVALSIVLIYKATGIFNFAVGQIMMVGGFVFWAFSAKMGMNVWLALLLSVAVGVILGWVVDRFTMRPLIGQSILAPIMVTLGLAYLFDGIVILIFSGSIRSLPEFLPRERIQLSNAVISSDLLWAFVIAVIIFGVLVLFFRRTRIGLVMRAAAESHVIAQARGINVQRIFGITWAISAGIAVIAGILLASRIGLEISIASEGLKAFPAVIFGGMESIPGALVGGLSIGLIENLSGGFIRTWTMEVAPYIVLLLVLIIKPEGLFGQRRIERI